MSNVTAGVDSYHINSRYIREWNYYYSVKGCEEARLVWHSCLEIAVEVLVLEGYSFHEAIASHQIRARAIFRDWCSYKSCEPFAFRFFYESLENDRNKISNGSD